MRLYIFETVTDQPISPFPFLELPAELRFQIYMLVVENACESSRFARDQANIVQPNLFRVCKMTRNETWNEGRQFFYQHHNFFFPVESHNCFQAIMKWLRSIGQKAREDIRHVQIGFIGQPTLAYMSHMGRLHVQLSDNTTVKYNANDGVDQLWRIGAACERRDRSSVPVFQIWGAYGLDERVTYNRPLAFGSVPGRPVELECSLVFLPGKSWFGPGGPRSVY